MAQPLVAVTTDVKTFENYEWHATPRQYLEAAVIGAGVLPLLVPSLGPMIGLDSVFAAVDGVIVTGSRSNVHPSWYGGDGRDTHGPYDQARDATTLPLIRAAIERGVPLLAICRGIQELNVAMGGTLKADIQDGPGIWDHRAPAGENQDERFAIRQPVSVAPQGCLAAILGENDVLVNSVHAQGIDRLAEGLRVEAEAGDGTIEAVSVRQAPGFAIGVQWHPEYWIRTDSVSQRLFSAFGDAVRAHRATRMGVAHEATRRAGEPAISG